MVFDEERSEAGIEGSLEQITNEQIEHIFSALGSIDCVGDRTQGANVYDQWKNNPLVRRSPADNNAGPEYFGRFGFRDDRTKRSYLQTQFLHGEARLLRLARLDSKSINAHYESSTGGEPQPSRTVHDLPVFGYKLPR